MILFKFSHKHNSKIITDLLSLAIPDISIELIDNTTGLFHTTTNLRTTLVTLVNHIQTDTPYTITFLETIPYPQLSLSAINFLHKLTPNSYNHLHDALILAMLYKNSHLINQFVTFYQNLPQDNIDIILELCHNGANIKQTAQNLFYHRNTITHHLQSFQDQTQLDIKDPNIQHLLRTLSILNVHHAQAKN